jgi:hypothetical protein
MAASSFKVSQVNTLFTLTTLAIIHEFIARPTGAVEAGFSVGAVVQTVSIVFLALVFI